MGGASLISSAALAPKASQAPTVPSRKASLIIVSSAGWCNPAQERLSEPSESQIVGLTIPAEDTAAEADCSGCGSLSSVRSETAFLSRLSSDSSSFRRRTWLSLRPPNSLRQRWYVASATPVDRMASPTARPCDVITPPGAAW